MNKQKVLSVCLAIGVSIAVFGTVALLWFLLDGEAEPAEAITSPADVWFVLRMSGILFTVLLLGIFASWRKRVSGSFPWITRRVFFRIFIVTGLVVWFSYVFYPKVKSGKIQLPDWLTTENVLLFSAPVVVGILLLWAVLKKGKSSSPRSYSSEFSEAKVPEWVGSLVGAVIAVAVAAGFFFLAATFWQRQETLHERQKRRDTPIEAPAQRSDVVLRRGTVRVPPRSAIEFSDPIIADAGEWIITDTPPEPMLVLVNGDAYGRGKVYEVFPSKPLTFQERVNKLQFKTRSEKESLLGYKVVPYPYKR